MHRPPGRVKSGLESMYNTSIFHTLIQLLWLKINSNSFDFSFLYLHLSTALFHWIAHYQDFREICCLPFEYYSFVYMVLYSCDDDYDNNGDDDDNHHGNVKCHVAFFSL